MGTLDRVVFHSPDWCDGPAYSPMVSHSWPRPVVDLLVEAKVQFTTNDVDLVCARFVGWCFTQPGFDTLLLGVHNLPAPAELDRSARYEWVMAEMGKWERPPILVNIDTSE